MPASKTAPNSGVEHVAYNYQDLVFTPYGPRWHALWRLCSLHLFSAKVLDGLHGTRESKVALLVYALAAGQSGPRPVNMGKIISMCSTNALARATAGLRVLEEEGVGAGEFKETVVELTFGDELINERKENDSPGGCTNLRTGKRSCAREHSANSEGKLIKNSDLLCLLPRTARTPAGHSQMP